MAGQGCIGVAEAPMSGPGGVAAGWGGCGTGNVYPYPGINAMGYGYGGIHGGEKYPAGGIGYGTGGLEAEAEDPREESGGVRGVEDDSCSYHSL